MCIRKVPYVLAVLLATTLTAMPGHAETKPVIAGDAEIYAGELIDDTSSLFASAWDYVTAPFVSGAATVLSPPTPMTTIRDIHNPDGSPFWDHLEDAGYKFKEVVTNVGIIPGIEFEFVIARELSEADRNALERKLDIDSKFRPGLIPILQRKIVNTLLEASEVEGMRIEALNLTMLPLPGVEFVLAPVEGPMKEEHDTIYRAIKELQKTVRRK